MIDRSPMGAPPGRPPRPQPRGFALIELPVFLGVIAAVATVLFMVVSSHLEKKERELGALQAETLMNAVSLYALHHKRLPSSLDALTAPLSEGKPIMEEVPLDPWDSNWTLETRGQDQFRIVSPGPDTQLDTEDDIHTAYRSL